MCKYSLFSARNNASPPNRHTANLSLLPRANPKAKSTGTARANFVGKQTDNSPAKSTAARGTFNSETPGHSKASTPKAHASTKAWVAILLIGPASPTARRHSATNKINRAPQTARRISRCTVSCWNNRRHLCSLGQREATTDKRLSYAVKPSPPIIGLADFWYIELYRKTLRNSKIRTFGTLAKINSLFKPKNSPQLRKIGETDSRTKSTLKITQLICAKPRKFSK
jgi:hypothetical protein